MSLVTAASLAGAVLGWRPAPDGDEDATAPTRPEHLATALVDAWAAGDRITLEHLAAPALSRQLGDDPAWRWPLTTPATDGTRLQLDRAEATGADRVVLSGTLAWGTDTRRVRILLSRSVGGNRAETIEWETSPSP